MDANPNEALHNHIPFDRPPLIHPSRPLPPLFSEVADQVVPEAEEQAVPNVNDQNVPNTDERRVPDVVTRRCDPATRV
jgi:hypothetical protein